MLFALTLFCAQAAASQPMAEAPAPETPISTLLNHPDAPYRLALHAELGFLWPAAHTIQFGKEGTAIDYVAEGGQDNLFPFLRPSIDLTLFDHHQVVFLYQPLRLVTTQQARRDLVVDDHVFAEGTPLRFTYGFDFWRLSYLYDLFAAPETELAFGASLQIRNADISTEALDGEHANYNRNIGPVPVLKFRARHDFNRWVWFGAEADGFWAPIRYINGGSADVEGAILDASVRGGAHLTPGVDAFINLRYLTGGARGTNSTTREPGDGYTENWLHFVALSLGFSLK